MNIFIISDTHFGHDAICSFTNDCGEKLRPFANAAEMDEYMITAWNSIVKPNDKVYHLGDVALTKKSLIKVMPQLNGTKVLVKGNHDREKLSVYARFFKDVRACHMIDNHLLTHIPIHPDSKARWKSNIHGHTHNSPLADPWYRCVCVEFIGYKPIALEEVLSWKQTD